MDYFDDWDNVSKWCLGNWLNCYLNMFDLLRTQRFHHFDGLGVAVRNGECKVNITIFLKIILKKQTPVRLIIVTSAKPTYCSNEANLLFHLPIIIRVRNNIDLPLKAHKSGQVDDNNAAFFIDTRSDIEVEPKIEAMCIDVVLQQEIENV